MGYQYILDMKDGYIVAFIDIIGFSNLIWNNKDVHEQTYGSIINYHVIVDVILDRYTEEYKSKNSIKF